MDSTLKFKVTDAQSHGDKELVGVGALAMASEKNQKLPVSDPLLSDETHKKASAITTKGAQAAISYMLTAGFFFFFGFSFLSVFTFCIILLWIFSMFLIFLYLILKQGSKYHFGVCFGQPSNGNISGKIRQTRGKNRKHKEIVGNIFPNLFV